MRMRSRERASEADASRWAWRWSIGLVLVVGLFPLAAAFFGELIARGLGCEVNFPQLGACTRSSTFLESFAGSMMSMIRWAMITVPTAIIVLVGLAITYAIGKKRGEGASR